MFKENFESARIIQDTPRETTEAPAEPENNYVSYKELGGLINEQDYLNTLLRAKSEISPSASTIAQVQSMARFADIELHTERRRRAFIESRPGL